LEGGQKPGFADYFTSIKNRLQSSVVEFHSVTACSTRCKSICWGAIYTPIDCTTQLHSLRMINGSNSTLNGDHDGVSSFISYDTQTAHNNTVYLLYCTQFSGPISAFYPS